MSLILNIETSTTVCSVALAEGEKLLSLKDENKGYTHAEKITVFIEDVLARSGKKLLDVDAVSVSNGPGSYTGLRIGASTAKGLCYALNKPLIAVDTLQALANQFITSSTYSQDGLLCPMIDARRMEVYCAIFDSALKEVLPVSAKVIDANSFAELLDKNKIYFFGDGAAKCRSVLSQYNNSIFVDGIFPSAQAMINLSYQKYLNKKFEDTSLYEPFYLKDVVAKRSINSSI